MAEYEKMAGKRHTQYHDLQAHCMLWMLVIRYVQLREVLHQNVAGNCTRQRQSPWPEARYLASNGVIAGSGR